MDEGWRFTTPCNPLGAAKFSCKVVAAHTDYHSFIICIDWKFAVIHPRALVESDTYCGNPLLFWDALCSDRFINDNKNIRLRLSCLNPRHI